MAPRPDPDPERDPEAARRRDAAAVLPLFGVLLLLPPFVNLFTREARLFGIPLEVVYLFGIWTALVLGALAMSRRLTPPADRPDRAGAAGMPPASGATSGAVSGTAPGSGPTGSAGVPGVFDPGDPS